MGTWINRLKPWALVPCLLVGVAFPVRSAEARRSHWDLGQTSWIRLVPREKGADRNDGPSKVDPADLIRALGAIRASTPDGEEALFSSREVAALAKPLAEALEVADPGEDLLLLSGTQRSGFLSAPLGVTARLFVKDGRLNLLVHDSRLEILGRFSPGKDWDKMAYGSRSKASGIQLRSEGALSPRSDWLEVSLRPAPATAAMPAAAAPVAVAPAPDLESRLRVLKHLREENLITEEEYQAKRGEILKGL